MRITITTHAGGRLIFHDVELFSADDNTTYLWQREIGNKRGFRTTQFTSNEVKELTIYSKVSDEKGKVDTQGGKG